MRNYVLILLALATVVPLSAQTVTGSLVGHISDSSGAAMAGVKVVATEDNRGVSRDTTSNEAGNYTISSMEPGIYTVKIEHSGFKSVVQQNVQVGIS